MALPRGAAGGILRGIQYTDQRNRLSQEREDKLKMLEYERKRQQQQDEMAKKQFDFQMKQMKQEATKAMLPYYAEAWKSGVMKNDPQKLSQVWKGLNLPAMTGLHAIEGVTEEDKQDMIDNGVIKENYNGPLDRFVKARTTSPDGNQRVEYKATDMISATLFGDYFTKKEQKEMLNKLTMQEKTLDLQETASKINKNVAATEKTSAETEQIGKEPRDPTKVLKVLESNQKLLAMDYANKVRNGVDVDTKTPEYGAAIKGEVNNIQNTKVAEEIDTLNTKAYRVNRQVNILERMENLPDTSFEQQARNWLGKLKDLTGLSEEDKNMSRGEIGKQLEDRVGLESSLAGYLADLIKEQSGAAVNEAEVQRKALELMGGDAAFTNKGTMLAAFGQHNKDTVSQLSNSLDNSLYSRAAPLSYKYLKDVINRYSNLAPKDTEEETKTDKKPLSAFELKD